MSRKLFALVLVVAGLLAVRVSAQTMLSYTITGQIYPWGQTDDRSYFDGVSYTANLSWDPSAVHATSNVSGVYQVTASMSVAFSNGAYLGSQPVVIIGQSNNYGFGSFTSLVAYYTATEVQTMPGAWAVTFASSPYVSLAGAPAGMKIRSVSFNFPTTQGTPAGVMTGTETLGWSYDTLVHNDSLSGGGVALASPDYPASSNGFGLGAVSGSIAPTAVPEPATCAALLGLAGLGLAVLRRRAKGPAAAQPSA